MLFLFVEYIHVRLAMGSWIHFAANKMFKNRCLLPCKCASLNLVFTEMCYCNGDNSNCDNVGNDAEQDNSESSETDPDNP
jgi:hypothetical protein